MSALTILLRMSNDLTQSIHDGMLIDDAKKMLRLLQKSSRLMLRGDEDLLELYDWLENNENIEYEDALLLLFDYLGIEQ